MRKEEGERKQRTYNRNKRKHNVPNLRHVNRLYVTLNAAGIIMDSILAIRGGGSTDVKQPSDSNQQFLVSPPMDESNWQQGSDTNEIQHMPLLKEDTPIEVLPSACSIHNSSPVNNKQ